MIRIETSCVEKISGIICISSISYPRLLDFHALVLELEGSLTISTGNQEKFTSRMKELSPEVSTKSVCNSKVFTVVGPCRHTYRFTLPLPQNVNQLPSSLESQNLSISYSLILYGRTATSYEQLDSCRVKIFGHDLINFPAEIESISVTSSNSPVHLEPPTPEKYHLVREPRFFANFEATRNIRDKVAIIVKLLDTRSLFWTQMEDKLVMDAESFKVARQRGTCLTPTHEGKMVDKNSSVKLVPFYNQRGEARIQLPGETDPSVAMEMMREVIIRAGNLAHGSSTFEIRRSTGSLREPRRRETTRRSLSKLLSGSVSSFRALVLHPFHAHKNSRRGSNISTPTLPAHFDNMEPFDC
ncbi:hypothetical protein Fcan01_15548 [Folsomia candida]|uniref:Uncharacterized protein n=1 Tax=Folsomia candida TaxID=158441 RepID=A0A226DY50_FOLCA|nr:hypothetical protein Fcan01_15548 [Folsomia candida]